MTRSVLSIRVLVALAFLVALVTITTPAAADPGTGTAVDVFFQQGPPGQPGTDCSWFWPWC